MSIAATPPPEQRRRQRRAWIIGGSVTVVLIAALAAEIIATRPVREAVTTYTALLAAANAGDLDAVGRLCTARYLRAHPPAPAREGGVVGLPRNIHKNFRAWRHGENVWLCPTNRIGPLYQFVFEAGAWRFDGPIGILRPRGEVVPYSDLIDAEAVSPEEDAASDAP
jgi:hypothetical protein